MGGVAQQCHRARRPARQRVAVADTPFVAVETWRASPAAPDSILDNRREFVDTARHHPGFVDPLVGDVAGENVVERPAADRITDHMTIRPDPADIFIADPIARFPGRSGRHALDRARCSASAICWVKRAGCAPNRLSRTVRVDAVGADDDVGLDLRSHRRNVGQRAAAGGARRRCSARRARTAVGGQQARTAGDAGRRGAPSDRARRTVTAWRRLRQRLAVPQMRASSQASET